MHTQLMSENPTLWADIKKKAKQQQKKKGLLMNIK
jgi:hypothetical protein